MGLSRDNAKIALQALHICIHLAGKSGGVIRLSWYAHVYHPVFLKLPLWLVILWKYWQNTKNNSHNEPTMHTTHHKNTTTTSSYLSYNPLSPSLDQLPLLPRGEATSYPPLITHRIMALRSVISPTATTRIKIDCAVVFCCHPHRHRRHRRL